MSDKIGKFLVSALPKVIKGLSVLGTIALMLVSGGIFVHNLEFLHDIFPKIPSLITEFCIGLIVGFIVLLVVKGINKIINSFKK